MKCFISIRGKKEPLEIPEESGRKIQQLKANATLDPSTWVNVADGLWSGEISKISMVDFVRNTVSGATPAEIETRRRMREEAEIRAMPIEERAKNVSKFVASFYMRSSKDWAQKRNPDEKEIAEAQKIQLAWLKKNKDEINIPTDIFFPMFDRIFKQ